MLTDEDPSGKADAVHESTDTRVTRVLRGGRTVIRKKSIGPDAQRRARHETAVLQRLTGVPGVVQLAGEADPGSVMLVDAGRVNLAEVGTPLPIEQLFRLGLGLARAVAGMHRRGVMHRNISPSNVVLDRDGAPCLVDFALATAVAEVRPEFTHPAQIAGELAYLAPEQTGRTGRAVDERADLYALGATLYELATGTPPFGWGDPLRLIRDHLTRVPAAPATANPAVPEPLSQIILHLLEKEPDHRYQSADGLAHDLQRLHDQVTAGLTESAVDSWRVGERDVALRLAPPSRLVGRDDEVAALAAAFDDAVAGRCRGVLVAGAAGVGKTALVDQLRSVVTGRDGWYVAGKFDQYRRDLEFDGTYQAFGALARLLLAEPEDELAAIRERMLHAVGPNAGLVTAASPEFAALLRVPPEPGDPLTAQARAQWVSLQILRAVASRKRPVLVFVDDLQWAGRTPVGFVDLVFSGEPVEGLLLVAAYREVDAAHPLAASTARWCAQDGVRQLGLADLPPSALAEMVAEMLHLDTGAAAGLAELIAEHTRGNPYETVELLNALRQVGVLTPAAGGWQWDEAAVRAHLLAADPARLLAGRTAALPASARRIVEAMACLGGRADPGLLAAVIGTPADVVEQHLTPALAEGLLVAEQGAVRFRHDRIREAVLAGLDAERRRGLHLAMARRLAEVPQWFAVAAEQYLPAVDAVESATERRQVVALLRRAAEQAALIGDHALISTLLGAAVRLVGPDETDTLLAVRTARQAALFSAGRLDEADDEYRAISELSPTTIGRADATAVQVLSLNHRNQAAEAITLGVETLRDLGIAVPTADRIADELDRRFRDLHPWLDHIDSAEELARPEITDPALLATIRLMNAVMPAAWFAGNPAVNIWLGLTVLGMWRDQGPAPSVVGPASSSVAAAVGMGGEQSGSWFRALRRVLAVGAARGFEPGTSQALLLVAAGPSWQFEPIENGVEAARRGREGLIAGGDLTNAAYTFYPAVYNLLDCAPTLDDVAAEVQAGLAFTRRTGNEQTGESLDGFRWLVAELRGEGSTATRTPSEGYAGSPPALFHTHYLRSVAAAVLGDAVALARHTAAAVPLLPVVGSQYPPAVVQLLRGLSLAEQARTRDGGDRTGLLAELDEVISWTAARAEGAPVNFGHLVRLLEAERAWAEGDFATAELAFDAALGEVASRPRPWHKALTAEHAARFYLVRGLHHVGQQLLGEARRHYAAWGAAAKVAQLDWAYPTPQPATAVQQDAPPADRSTAVTSGTIDLLGILSASQALSSETTIARLHARVADVLAAMTGATHVRMLLRDHDRWCIPTPTGTTALITGHEHTAPMTALRYLLRTDEPLVVADVTADDRFARDPYFAGTAHCALLAVPVYSRGTLRAALLLENRLLRGAFTAERLDAVTLIAGQLAVSLDNAQLYADLTASRQRIVTTADHTRRRIERDLHDGAQQRIVSIAMQLRAAQSLVPPELQSLATRLGDIASDATTAVDELREVAHGIHPSVLTHNGLPPALRALARRCPVPVTLDLHLDGRLPEPIETGAYYLIAEALTNTAKHAHASTVTVTVTVEADVLLLTVTDDGIGGADITRGSGILGLKDRAEALGGFLTLDSPPDAGTRLHVRLPLTAETTTADAASGAGLGDVTCT